jgi:hypothetical protein
MFSRLGKPAKGKSWQSDDEPDFGSVSPKKKAGRKAARNAAKAAKEEAKPNVEAESGSDDESAVKGDRDDGKKLKVCHVIIIIIIIIIIILY